MGYTLDKYDGKKVGVKVVALGMVDGFVEVGGSVEGERVVGPDDEIRLGTLGEGFSVNDGAEDGTALEIVEGLEIGSSVGGNRVGPLEVGSMIGLTVDVKLG